MPRKATHEVTWADWGKTVLFVQERRDAVYTRHGSKAYGAWQYHRREPADAVALFEWAKLHGVRVTDRSDGAKQMRPGLSDDQFFAFKLAFL